MEASMMNLTDNMMDNGPRFFVPSSVSEKIMQLAYNHSDLIIASKIFFLLLFISIKFYISTIYRRSLRFEYEFREKCLISSNTTFETIHFNNIVLQLHNLGVDLYNQKINTLSKDYSLSLHYI